MEDETPNAPNANDLQDCDDTLVSNTLSLLHFSHPPPLQIQSCSIAEALSDCPEKRRGTTECQPILSGVFDVQERPIVLHVGLDVQNDLSCMTQADGILMGCSTFGQVAGLVNRGLKFFSVGCRGRKTAPHYKMIPPMVRSCVHLYVQSNV